ncbi:hypothetical protein PFISCL1PPCAC_11572 [Pristionchus fissidentatus]|uniref:Uncharacterized protein n=1 Tax=Pristionchus fissidentatus TaxID=1538716 RepID=A0AAV5VNM8_9BILA|nr:hypothetical protein PFISCL1PPCAC_11572 [Pristionchus fissidentatus]
MAHLRKKHHTTAQEAGITFRCACGNESRSEFHYKTCRSESVEIVRDDEDAIGTVKRSREAVKRQFKAVEEDEKDGRMDWTVRDEEIDQEEEEVEGRQHKRAKKTRENVSTTVMHCVKCDKFETYDVIAYIGHLSTAHRMTPRKAGVSFHCACGHVCRSNSHASHGKCGNVSVTVVRDEEENMEEEAGEKQHEEGEDTVAPAMQ